MEECSAGMMQFSAMDLLAIMACVIAGVTLTVLVLASAIRAHKEDES